VKVNGNNQNTQRWMSVLTQAGLYSEPELITESTGFFQSTNLIYRKTEAGKKATESRQLCIADGVTVARVTSFTPPEKLGATEISYVDVTLALKNPMPWVNTEVTHAVAPSLGKEFDARFSLNISNGKWEVMNDALLRNALMDQRKSEQINEESQASSRPDGIFETLKRLFSSTGGNPLIGRWKSDVMGDRFPSFEFDSDTMTSNGKKVRVRYEVEDQRVTVYHSDSLAGSVFYLIDKDTVSVNSGMMEVRLNRVH